MVAEMEKERILDGDPWLNEEPTSKSSSVDFVVTVVMPCLDEARTLGDCVHEAMQAMEDAGIVGEVVVADNGSVDGSQAIASNHGARVVQIAARGYGNALRGGIQASRGEFVIMGDCDGSYDFSHIPRILSKLREGNDLVLGNRFLGGVQKDAMPWLHRYLGNPVLTTIGRMLFRCPVADFHCGLRGLKRSSFDRMQLRTTGMEFASEMVVKTRLAGMRMAEVPTVLRPDGRDRPPHLRSWRDGWRHLRFMLLLSPRWLFVWPGCLLAAVGTSMVLLVAAVGGELVPGIHLSVNTSLAFALLTMFGSQLVMTGVFARVAATRLGILPGSDLLRRLSRRFSLESGVVAGMALMVLGVSGFAAAAALWGKAGFGDLDSRWSVQVVIPAVLFVNLGMQLLFGSFLLALLGMASNVSKDGCS